MSGFTRIEIRAMRPMPAANWLIIWISGTLSQLKLKMPALRAALISLSDLPTPA